jgi:hypothetical protein
MGPDLGGEVRQEYKIGTSGHVVRLSSIGLIEARGLLVPGQRSTAYSGVLCGGWRGEFLGEFDIGKKKAEVAELGWTSPVSA